MFIFKMGKFICFCWGFWFIFILFLLFLNIYLLILVFFNVVVVFFFVVLGFLINMGMCVFKFIFCFVILICLFLRNWFWFNIIGEGSEFFFWWGNLINIVLVEFDKFWVFFGVLLGDVFFERVGVMGLVCLGI